MSGSAASCLPNASSELLATGDLHVVPLRRGLAHVSVPSKTYSILAAGRPVLAAIDAGTTIPRILEESGAGVSVAPDDPEQFTAAIADLVADRPRLATMGKAGRRWVESAASPAAVAQSYEALIRELAERPGRGVRGAEAPPEPPGRWSIRLRRSTAVAGCGRRPLLQRSSAEWSERAKRARRTRPKRRR